MRSVLIALLMLFWVSSVGALATAVDVTQLMLARAGFAECGWNHPNCHAGVYFTMKNRSRMRRRTVVQVVQEYCAAWDPRTKRDRAKMARALRADLQQPAYWPHHLLWSDFRPRWGRLLAYAGKFQQGKVKNPCDGRPYHTNGLVDVGRVPAHWTLLSCGDTGDQRFYGLD